MSKNYTVDKEGMDVALNLFDGLMKYNNELGESIMESKDAEIADLRGLTALLNSYIDYVEKCISLQVVPNTFYFWSEFINRS
jgi:hypothetical protein